MFYDICPEEKSRFFATCSIHLQATAIASHLQLQSCGHFCGDPFSACALLLRPLGLDEMRSPQRQPHQSWCAVRVLRVRRSWLPCSRISALKRRVGSLQLARFICKPLQLQAICNCNPVGMLVGGPAVIPFLHVRSCSGCWTWMRSASRSGSLISLGARAAGSKVLGSHVQNMAWLHCCCSCCVLSPVLLPFVLRFCSFTLSASSWAGGLEESGVERGVRVPGIEQGRVGHFQLARFIRKPLQAICNCNPVGLWACWWRCLFCICAPLVLGLG